jgi:hypothetical protein
MDEEEDERMMMTCHDRSSSNDTVRALQGLGLPKALKRKVRPATAR